MKRITIDSSSDEDDPYTNSAARLKKLKIQRLEREKLSIKKDELYSANSEQINDKETDCDGIQTRSRIKRSIRSRNNNNQIKQKLLPVDDIECNVEIVSVEEEPEAITVFCNNDIVTLSDDAYSEDENYEINVKIYWRSSRIDRFSILKHDTFQRIFQHYADLEKVSMDEILIMKKDKIVSHNDTPASLKLSVIDILDGGIVNPGMNVLIEDKQNENTCSIKIQTANKKQSFTILHERNQQFKMLLTGCAKQLDIKESSLKLYFDGEQIDPRDTPESLDLEEEACIDLHIST